MKIIRYLDFSGKTCFGQWHSDGRQERLEGDLFGSLRPTGEPADIITLLAPLVPACIYGVGLNYRRHAEESGMPPPENPVVFLKPNSALQHPEQPVRIPRHLASTEVDYEVELAVVIGRTGRNISREKALNHVLGYTCANDVSARDWQLRRGGGQWCRGKMFDTFAPLGPCLVTRDELPDPHQLRLCTRLNGEERQNWTSADMIFDIPTLIEFLSGSTTLEAGTVILTGTPHGVGMAARPPRWLQPGDVVEVEIEGIGTLRNPVELEAG